MLDYITERVEAGKEIAEDQIEPPLLYSSQEYLNIFWELHAFRSSNGMGPNVITLPDIDAYCRYSGLVLKWSEIKLVKLIDGLYLKHFKVPKRDGG